MTDTANSAQGESHRGHDHGHHQHHHHDHDHNHDNSLSHDDRNIAHWNKVAKTYNSDHTQKQFGDLINKTAAFVLANIASIGVNFLDPSSAFESQSSLATQPAVRVLDYACGPGTVTNILAGRATEFIGLDISPNMVAEYNSRFSSQTDGEKLNAHAYHANLFDPAGVPESFNDPKFFDFDLVTVGFGFHHFENLPMVTQRLVDRIKPGGVLMILDFFPHKANDMGDNPALNTIAHNGFTEAQIKGLFETAGLEDNQVFDFGEEVLMRGVATRRPFMARGRKPLQKVDQPS